jgi:DNA-binding NarL/FixJ family response regulator
MTVREPRGPTRVLIVEDHTIVREGLHLLLQRNREIAIVGEASSGREAIELAAALQPDVILMDIRLPDIDGLEATQRIKTKHPNIAVIMLTMHDDEEYVIGAVRVGAAGYILKDISPNDLVSAIQTVHDGGTIIEPSLLRRTLGTLALSGPAEADRLVDEIETLTPREQEVLNVLVEGLTNREIGQALFISEQTVKTHVSAIIQKLGASDRTQAAVIALRQGLIH